MRPKYFSILILTIIAAITVILISGCQAGKSPYDTDVESVIEMLNSDNRPVIIDVRTRQEFVGNLGHIPGARLISLISLKDSIDVFKEYEGRDIIMVCRSGNRSGRATKILRENGFENVYNLAGGMKRWNKLGGEISKAN